MDFRAKTAMGANIDSITSKFVMAAVLTITG